VALEIKGDWCPPVFAHYQIYYLVPVNVLCYLQTLKVSYDWCADYMKKIHRMARVRPSLLLWLVCRLLRSYSAQYAIM
jgi:hypothetical protein